MNFRPRPTDDTTVSSPRFRFGLERVREIRAHDEDRAKEAFAASLAQRMRGAALLAAASEPGRRAPTRRRREGAAAASGSDLVSMQAYLDRVEQSRRDAERDLAQSEAALAERRVALDRGQPPPPGARAPQGAPCRRARRRGRPPRGRVPRRGRDLRPRPPPSARDRGGMPAGDAA